ncbi:MAG: hypothetical protein EOO00_12650 [Chitinophagaceae bacterium]|nr:MAG: hypothetical protein EOO00_12650 [Chitinophagaceae bacterium]
MKIATYLSVMVMVSVMTGCGGEEKEKPVSGNGEVKDEAAVRLITLDPGHFHAALVQKTMYPGIDSQVYVYAPGGAELDAHMSLINSYKERSENPATWKEVVYTGNDFFNKMIAGKKGNVVVLAGNNRQKTEYIQQSVDAGLNVLADKPMAINEGDFSLLTQAFDAASKKAECGFGARHGKGLAREHVYIT